MRHKGKTAALSRGLLAGARGVRLALALAGALAFVSACGAMPKTPIQPPFGVIVTSYKAPLDIKMGPDGEIPVPANPRHGVSETHYVNLPLLRTPLAVGWGDAAIKQAAENGGMKKVYFADYETFMILGVYANFRVHVYGE